MPRTVDPFDFKDQPVYEMPLDPPLEGNLPEGVFERRFEHLNNWLEKHCEGLYLILIKHVIFNNEKDAVFFMIGYKQID